MVIVELQAVRCVRTRPATFAEYPTVFLQALRVATPPEPTMVLVELQAAKARSPSPTKSLGNFPARCKIKVGGK